MKKKLVAMLLTSVMVMSMAACGQEDGQNSQNTRGDSQSSGQESEGAASDRGSDEAEASDNEDNGVGDDSGELNLYGFDEPVTVKVGISYAAASDFTFYGGETVENNTWVDLYKANNIIPEILYEVDPSQADTKLSTAIMSGDYPDVFSTNGSEYMNMAESGAVADITDVFEQYASEELKAYMTNDGGMALESLYIDGRLYGLPRLNSDPYSSANMMWIRQDWLDNLNLEIPTTMEELKEVAHAFTYNDPDGDGQDNTYGLALDGINVINTSIGNMDPVFNAYGAYFGSNGLTYLEGENGEVVWGGANTEGVKAALQLLQDMYKDGSIARDFITMDYESIFEETGAGRCGIWFGPTWGAMQPSAGATQNDINCHMVAARVPTGLDTPTKAYASSRANTVYYLSSKCEHPELFIKLWNLSVKYQNASNCTDEEYNMYYGDSANYSGWKTSIIYGGGPDGKMTNEALVAAFETGETSNLNAKVTENYNSIKTYVDAVADGTLDPSDAAHQRGLALYTVHIDPKSAWSVIHDMMATDSYVMAAYNGVPSEEVSNVSSTLQRLLVETIVKIITGEQTVDSYDEFLNTWYAMGGDIALEEANAAR